MLTHAGQNADKSPADIASLVSTQRCKMQTDVMLSWYWWLLIWCVVVTTAGPPRGGEAVVEEVRRHRQPLRVLEGTLLLLAQSQGDFKSEPADAKKVLPEYDFVVVGAGTAGCVVANRLSEIGNWTILLLEAGGGENFAMDIPLAASYIQFSDANWNFTSEPSIGSCLGMQGGRCRLPRGKVLGGSSSLNFMIHTRGNRRDYDGWEAAGNPGWGYDHVLPYFKKSESVMDPELAKDKRFHGTEGPHVVSTPSWRTPLAKAFVEGGRELGFPAEVDFNGPTQCGFSYLQVSLKNGTRWSESRAYLHPAGNRPNLHVRRKAHVNRILLSKFNVATGVKFTSGKNVQTVKARKEVIVCAGAIGSPHLLLLSGIGPREHLDSMGVHVLKNIPGVGGNLQDHVALGGLIFLVNDTVSLRTQRLLDDPKNFIDYLTSKTGPASIPGGCEALAFLDTKRPWDPDGYPDVELLFQGGSLISDPVIPRTFGIQPDLYQAVYSKVEHRDSWMTFPMVLRPKSRGSVILRSSDPAAPPRIITNYLSHPDDISIIVRGIRVAQQLSRTAPMQRFESKLHDVPLPGCTGYLFDSDEYWACATRHLTFNIYHQCGTCKMGPSSDPDAVVDSRLRVRGVRNLRIVDASVIPVIPAAHTNAPTVMIAEKAADMIKEDWGSCPQGDPLCGTNQYSNET